jgi:hypothetical protein
MVNKTKFEESKHYDTIVKIVGWLLFLFLLFCMINGAFLPNTTPVIP